MPHDPDTCHPEYKRYFVPQEQSASAAAERAKTPLKCWRALVGQTMTTASALEMIMVKLEARDGRPAMHEPGVDLNECNCMSCLWSDAHKFSVKTRLLIGHLNHAFVRMEDKIQDAYAREDDLLEEVADLKELLANVSAEQLVKLEEEGANKKAGTVKKKKKAKAKKTKKGSKPGVMEGNKLVPVFGDAPATTKGAFAVLEESGDERVDPALDHERRVPISPVAPPSNLTPPLNPLAASMQWSKFDGKDLLACLNSLHYTPRISIN